MKETTLIKVVVEKDFPDRYTGMPHKKGEEMLINYDRLAEIRRTGKDLVKVVGKVKAKKAATDAAEPKEKK